MEQVDKNQQRAERVTRRSAPVGHLAFKEKVGEEKDINTKPTRQKLRSPTINKQKVDHRLLFVKQHKINK